MKGTWTRLGGLAVLALLLAVPRASGDDGDLTPDSGGIAAPPASGAPRAAGLSGAKILFVADSHGTMAFGDRLDALLQAAGAKVARFAVSSSRPTSWLTRIEHGEGYVVHGYDGKVPQGLDVRKGVKRFCVDGGRRTRIKETGSCPEGQTTEDKHAEFIKTPSFGGLLKDYAPTVTIVALGTNIPTGREQAETILHDVAAAGSACVWVGPPSVRNNKPADTEAVYKVLGELIVPPGTPAAAGKYPCLLIDSRPAALPYLQYPGTGGDGWHFYGPALGPLGRRWADDVFARVSAAP